jgi:Ferritin-like domain
VPDELAAGGAAPPGAAGTTSRRSLLIAAGAMLPVLVTACKGVQSLGTPPPPPADIRVLRAAIAAEELMVARYATAITQLTDEPSAGPATVLAAVRTVQAEHVAHLSQLRSRLIEPAGTSPAPAASRAPLSAAGGGVTGVLTALEQAEEAASDRLLGQLGGLPPALAQLCASVAASEATHVPFLQQAAAAAG